MGTGFSQLQKLQQAGKAMAINSHSANITTRHQITNCQLREKTRIFVLLSAKDTLTTPQ
jgi:hypothetical protein